METSYLLTASICDKLNVFNFKPGIGDPKFIQVVLGLPIPVCPIPEFQSLGGHGVGHFGRQDHFGRRTTLVAGPILPVSHYEEYWTAIKTREIIHYKNF